MDGKTKHTLSRITRNIPKHLHDITRVEIDTSEEEAAKILLKQGNLPKEQREQIARLIEKGAFRREEVVVDEQKVKELDAYHEREIAKAKRAGMLSNPSDDPFWKKRQAKIKQKEHENTSHSK